MQLLESQYNFETLNKLDNSSLLYNIWLWVHLIAEDNVYFAASGSYSQPHSYYEVYNYPLGKPISDLTEASKPDGSIVWQRSYERGTIEFDKTASSINQIRFYPILVLGDLFSDGDVTIQDAVLAARIAVGLDPLGDKLKIADVDGTGNVTAYDAALITQRATGLIRKFPIE